MKTIYTLADPITENIYYVGCTGDTKVRLYQHKTKKTHPSTERICSLGQSPIIEAIEEVADEYAASVEIYWIQQFICWGFKLENRIIDREFSIKAESESLTKEQLEKLNWINDRLHCGDAIVVAGITSYTPAYVRSSLSIYNGFYNEKIVSSAIKVLLARQRRLQQLFEENPTAA